jgi:hypothetical protein
MLRRESAQSGAPISNARLLQRGGDEGREQFVGCAPQRPLRCSRWKSRVTAVTSFSRPRDIAAQQRSAGLRACLQSAPCNRCHPNRGGAAFANDVPKKSPARGGASGISSHALGQQRLGLWRSGGRLCLDASALEDRLNLRLRDCRRFVQHGVRWRRWAKDDPPHFGPSRDRWRRPRASPWTATEICVSRTAHQAPQRSPALDGSCGIRRWHGAPNLLAMWRATGDESQS